MPRGKAAATPVNPYIQKWLEANGEVKLAMDKRKGEQGIKGLQAAREYFCKGVKIMTALLVRKLCVTWSQLSWRMVSNRES